MHARQQIETTRKICLWVVASQVKNACGCDEEELRRSSPKEEHDPQCARAHVHARTRTHLLDWTASQSAARSTTSVDFLMHAAHAALTARVSCEALIHSASVRPCSTFNAPLLFLTKCPALLSPLTKPINRVKDGSSKLDPLVTKIATQPATYNNFVRWKSNIGASLILNAPLGWACACVLLILICIQSGIGKGWAVEGGGGKPAAFCMSSALKMGTYPLLRRPAAPYIRTASGSNGAPALPPSLEQKSVFRPLSCLRIPVSWKVPLLRPDLKRRSWQGFFSGLAGTTSFQTVRKGRFTRCRRWEKSQCMEEARSSQLDWTMSCGDRGVQSLCLRR